MQQHEREKQQASGQEAGVANVAQPFGKMLLSMAPNGMIGCLEFLILSVLGWLLFTVILIALVMLMAIWSAWGISLLTPAVPLSAASSAVNAYDAGGFGILAVIFSIGALLCLLAGLVFSVMFCARLLQLRLIDIGLGKVLSIPGLCARFWPCLLASIVCSLFTPLALLLFIFCCVCQGKTYVDRRDVFKPVPPVPPVDEIGEKMHRRK